MAAEAIGKSQKRKNKMATIGMVIFFSILAILIIIPVYAIVLASFKTGKSPSSVWFEPESGRGEYDVG